MAQNDMYVVMYKILGYLYECMKNGTEPESEKFSYSALNIPECYWCDILHELFSKKLIAGVTIVPMGSHVHVNLNRPRVTMDGVQFMQENSMMAKARKFLVDTKSALPIPWL